MHVLNIAQCFWDHCLIQITGVGSRMQEPENTAPGTIIPFQRYLGFPCRPVQTVNHNASSQWPL